MESFSPVITMAAVFLGIPIVMSLIIGGMIVLGVRLNQDRRSDSDDKRGNKNDEPGRKNNTGCLEADKAPCVSHCPLGALAYDEHGRVVFTPEICPFGYRDSEQPHLEEGEEGRVSVVSGSNAPAK